MDDNRLALIQHAGSGNHGCEALVDSLVRMLPEEKIILVTNSRAEDEKYLPEVVKQRLDIREEQHIADHVVTHTMLYAWRKISHDRESFLRYRFRPITSGPRENRPALAAAIGGDNYCYAEMVDDLILTDAMLHRQGTKTILVGCSVEPALLQDARLLEDLRSYEMITARESITYQALLEAGIPEEKVKLCPDPAFTLPTDTTNLPAFMREEDQEQDPNRESGGNRGRSFDPYWARNQNENRNRNHDLNQNENRCESLPRDRNASREQNRNAGRAQDSNANFTQDSSNNIRNIVGINLSPLVANYAEDKTIARRSFSELIRYILRTSDARIALIPHVVWNRSDDRQTLRELYHAFADTGRVFLVDDAPAEQLKGIISRCRFLITARTHASIAGYSTGVPTLVLGYSVKARGIAHDLFGTDEHYVLPIQQLKDPQQLISSYTWLAEHEMQIHTQLLQIMPTIIKNAQQNAEVIRAVQRLQK